MTYTLYYGEGSAAMGVRAILEEIGVPYELITTDFSMDSPRAQEVLDLNPNGWIPILKWEQGSIYECGAITTFLCDRHPEKKLSPDINDSNRGLFLQWLFFFSSSIQNAYQMTYYPFRFCNAPEDESSVQKRSIERLNETWQVIDDSISNNEWMLGTQFSAVDIYLFMLITWLSKSHNHPEVDSFSNVHRIYQNVARRPSIQLVYKNHLQENPI